MQVYEIHTIEDSDADYLAFSRSVEWSMERLSATARLTRHLEVSQAFQALLDGSHPDLIFVDINLPLESGVAFLRQVKREPRIIPCPKIILTTSTSENDVVESFAEGAAGYLVKPLAYFELREAVRDCLEYWLVTSRRPASEPGGDKLTGAPPPPRC